MKKTLITLAAVAMVSVAVAESLTPDLTYTNPASATTAGTYTGENYSFTLSIVLDLEKALSTSVDLGTYVSPSGVALQKQANWWTNGIAIWDADEFPDKVCISIRDGEAKSWFSESQITGTIETASGYPLYDSADAWNGKIALTYTYTADSNGVGTQTLYILKKGTDGSLVQDSITRTTDTWALSSEENPLDELVVTNTDGIITSLYVFDTALTASEAKSFATKVIPEPTTATLSLLALAGLAARRRRK